MRIINTVKQLQFEATHPDGDWKDTMVGESPSDGVYDDFFSDFVNDSDEAD